MARMKIYECLQKKYFHLTGCIALIIWHLYLHLKPYTSKDLLRGAELTNNSISSISQPLIQTA
jgi:hypothetical protein